MPPHDAVTDRTAILQKTHDGEYHSCNELSDGAGRPAATFDSQKAGERVGKLSQQQGQSKERQGKSEIEKHKPSTALKLGDHTIVRAGHLNPQANTSWFNPTPRIIEEMRTYGSHAFRGVIPH